MKPEVKFTVDPEFESLIPPLSDDEFKQLRENILEVQEVYDPLITWNGVLIDGHNRWKIIQENPDVRYKTTEVIFYNRNEAILWIINNQLGRRNLEKSDAIDLAEKRAEVTAQMAKAKQAEAGGDRRSEVYKETASVQMDKTDSKPIDTRKEIAKLAGVSTGTVARYQEVKKKAPELVPKIKSGELTIGGAYREVKEAEKPTELPAPIATTEPPKYTLGNLLSEVNANTDGYIQFVRRTLTEHSTMLQNADNRTAVKETINKAKAKLEELEKLLK